MPAHRASGARRFSATDQPPEAPRSLALGITLLRFRLLIHNYSSYEKTGYYFSVTSFTYVPDSTERIGSRIGRLSAEELIRVIEGLNEIIGT